MRSTRRLSRTVAGIALAGGVLLSVAAMGGTAAADTRWDSAPADARGDSTPADTRWDSAPATLAPLDTRWD
ncbi:hypothetical protein ACFWBN_02105 [Streptomyces sp. NPDC059989]|uniref:hypothetical protein n=1 Tax=Streptomyces sp. NPDC059989 TaxID=3347026 RepID=UPI00368E39C9